MGKEGGAGHLHTGMRLLLGEVAGQTQVRDAHMAVLVQKDVGRLWRKLSELLAGQAGGQLGVFTGEDSGLSRTGPRRGLPSFPDHNPNLESGSREGEGRGKEGREAGLVTGLTGQMC